MVLNTSQRLFDRSKSRIPGGVNSPVRSYSSLGGTPPFIAGGKGSQITDVDGDSYIDYVMSWGPLILGHAHPDVVEAVRAQAELGVSYGAPTELELELAEIITDAFESIDMVRLVNSGTEACMTALRLARAFTGRDKILKFEGCYHGHSDGLLVQAGSGAAWQPSHIRRGNHRFPSKARRVPGRGRYLPRHNVPGQGDWRRHARRGVWWTS